MTSAPKIDTLSRDYAAKHADLLLSFTVDQAWENWTVSNLLGDRPRKWDLSLVQTIDATACGYAIISEAAPAVHHLHHIAVSPSVRGRELGTLLMRSALERAAREECDLRLKVHLTNVDAIRLYERLGFAQVTSDDEYTTMIRARAS